MGSSWYSFTSTCVVPPSSLSVMSVLTPESEWRIRISPFGSTVTGTPTGNLPSLAVPYTTAGSRPAARWRRASFLPESDRLTASSVASISSSLRWSGRLKGDPHDCLLHEQRGDRRLLVNVADGL